MSEMTLHPTPRLRDIVLDQIRIVVSSLRIEALLFAAFLGGATVLIVGDLLSGGPGFDSDEIFSTALIAFLFPFALWRRDKPFGSAFLWTLPVDRRRLALARVFAGFVWLMSALAIFISWLLTLALIAEVSLLHTFLRVPIVATIAAYLIGSAVVLGLRHPVRWLAGAGGVFLLMGRTIRPHGRIDNTIDHAWETWLTLPNLTQFLIFTSLSLGVGLIALWVAASRHKETR